MAAISEPNRVPLNKFDYSWYKLDTDINDELLTPIARDVFESYSKVPSDQVIDHIRKFRAAAFSIFPYPCIGELRFLDFSISQLPSYQSILQRLKAEPTATEELPPELLDIGCCVGQDLRKLVHDGVPPNRLTGAELRQEFVDMGYDLFRDRDSFDATFVVGDALSDNEKYAALKHHFDIIHAASFLHLFNWETQVKMAAKMVGLLKDKPGVVVVGRQAGGVEEHFATWTNRQHASVFLHNESSFQKMWDEVSEKTGTNWQVQAHLRKRMDPNTRSICGGRERCLLTFEAVRSV